MPQTLMHPGNTFYASVLNGILYILQQPTGGQETGKYEIESNVYISTAFVSCPINTWSRNSTPVSASVDTADDAYVGLSSVTTGHLTMGGMQIFAAATTTGADLHCGGNWTIQY